MPDADPSPLRVLAWPARRSQNPYPELVAEAVIAAGAEAGREVVVEEFRPATAWRARADIVHLHWPEFAVDSPSPIKAAAKVAMVRFGLRRLHRRGARFVWTRHNTSSHEAHHPRLEAAVRRTVDRLLDGVIDLQEGAGAPAGVRRAVIRHGDYGAVVRPGGRATARRELGLPDDAIVLCCPGSIRPYKRVPELIDAIATAATADPRLRLVVAGRPTEEATRREVETAAAGVDAVTTVLDWIEDDHLERILAAADLVVLPYRRLENSGVLLLGLTAARPVAATSGAAVDDARLAVGDQWVRPLDDMPDAAVLAELVAWAAEPRPAAPDLSPYAWPEIGRQTLAFYDEVRASDRSTRSGRRR